MGIKRFTKEDFEKRYPDEDACLHRIFELRYKNLVCPKCESDNEFKRVKNRRAYQCPACAFQLYPTQGTVFEKSTTPLTYWFYAIFLQTTTRNGVSAKELERALKICYKTALRMSHQIKLLIADKDFQPLEGVVEADECFIGGLNKNRHADKKTPKENMAFDKTPVVGVVKRGGKVTAKVVTHVTEKTLRNVIENATVKDATVLITDEYIGYRNFGKERMHVVVNHSVEEYVRGAFHTNTIEGFWSHLKRTIKGTHIHVSKKHLQKYVDEVAFRYSHRDKQDEMFEIILSHVV